MAQYFRVTSLEELHHLYPHLKIENIEGIQCMIQDDQLAQINERQGQQLIATIDQANIQIPQNAVASLQCSSSSRKQFILQQPTQFVIQQIDPNKASAEALQLFQQNYSSTNQDENLENIQYTDHTLKCIENSATRKQHIIVKSMDNKQFAVQTEPIGSQSLQIHQSVQTLDVDTNIIVFQNKDQELPANANKKQDFVANEHIRQSHIIIQQKQKQQVSTQTQQLVSKDENSSYYTQQLMQTNQTNCTAQIEGQQHIFNHSDQHVFQPYLEQLKVTGGFSSSCAESSKIGNNNLEKSESIILQAHQYQCKEKKIVQPSGTNSVFQQNQVLIPQKLEMPASSQSLTSRISQCRKNISQGIESSAPVIFVQKFDSPLFIRQPQAKIGFQNSIANNDKGSENYYHLNAKQLEKNSKSPSQVNQELIYPKAQSINQSELIEKISDAVLGLQGQTEEEILGTGQIKIGILEQPSAKRGFEQGNKTKVLPSVVNKVSLGKTPNKVQQSDLNLKSHEKEVNAQLESSGSNDQGVPFSHIQFHARISGNQREPQIMRESHSVMVQTPKLQYCTKGKEIQIQTSPPNQSVLNETDCSKNKSVQGEGRIGKGVWNAGGVEQRNVFVGSGKLHLSSTPSVNDINQKSIENEDVKMLVVLLNGEKKILKIPCSQQSILLGQILHQAGISVSSPTSVAVEQVLDTSKLDQCITKISLASNQQSSSCKSPLLGQLSCISTTVDTPSNVLGAIRQQSSLSNLQQTPNLNVSRQDLKYNASKPITSASLSKITSVLTTENTHLQPQGNQIISLSTPTKEEPRFISGYMAICPFCGIQSLDFNKCIRCRRKLPENVKSQSILNAKNIKLEKVIEHRDKILKENKLHLEGKNESLVTDRKEKISLLQVNEKRKVKPCFKKKKISDEPAEILILSSDEEDNNISKAELKKEALPHLGKEPAYMHGSIPHFEVNSIMKENKLNDDLMKNELPGSFTTILCRAIRVGSYKVQPKERVLISNKEIRLVIDSLKNENVVMAISFSDIVKVLVHFGKQFPVIFVYPFPKVALQIRNALGMDDKRGPYYDPLSHEEETHKRITLLVEKISEDNKIILHKIFGQEKLEELSEKEANDILIRASPYDVQNACITKTNTVRKIMVYPPPPEKGGITLNNQDYACLGEDQFLNDVIIDFYLKYLLLKVLSQEDRNRTHVFSTFFYKRLTTKPKSIRKNDPENDPKLSPAEKRHLRVKGWTKQVNLFEKDFVIVPINEHSHWFLAIICFPGLNGPVRFADNTPIELEEVHFKKDAQNLQIGNTTVTHVIKSDGNTVSLEMDCGSDRDEAEGDQDDLHPSTDDESELNEEDGSSNTSSVQIPLLSPISQSQFFGKDSKSKSGKRKVLKEPIKQPCILIFDSLAGASRVRVVATLRDYLKVEYKTKMGQDKEFSKDTIKGAVPKVPQQNNFTDCGLYVLQYVESFFQDPLHDFKLPLKYLQEWFPEEVVACKRQKLATLIRNLMEEQGIKVEDMGLPVLTFTSGTNLTENQPRSDEGEGEDEEDEITEDDVKNQCSISDFDNELEGDIDLGGENEEYDAGEVEEDDKVKGEKLSSRWIMRPESNIYSTSNDLNSSVKKNECSLMKINSLVDYDESESEEEEGGGRGGGEDGKGEDDDNEEEEDDEDNDDDDGGGDGEDDNDGNDNNDDDDDDDDDDDGDDDDDDDDDDFSLSRSLRVFDHNEVETSSKKLVDAKYYKPKQSSATEVKKCANVREKPDFESQIICSTREKNFDSKINESEMIVSDEDYEMTGSRLKASCISKYVSVNPSLSRTIYLTEKKNVEVKDVEKIVTDSVAVSTKQETNSGVLKKQLNTKRFKIKDCDKFEDMKRISNPLMTQKNIVPTHKRTYQSLKSVRIHKKRERKFDIPGKRQKMDKT